MFFQIYILILYHYIVPFDPLLLKPQVITGTVPSVMEEQEYDPRVSVYTTKSSWQTTESWYQWIRGIAKVISEQIHGQHIILVDSYRVHFAHPVLIEELKRDFRCHLRPLVKNATQFIQPMDQLIIPRLKRSIRR